MRRVAVVLVVAALLGVLIAMAVAGQRSLMYFPDATPVGHASVVLAGGEDVGFPASDGLRLQAWWVRAEKPVGPDRVAVLYMPGNGGSRQERAPLAEAMAVRGMDVLLVDYRGYGGNPSSPSEERTGCRRSWGLRVAAGSRLPSGQDCGGRRIVGHWRGHPAGGRRLEQGAGSRSLGVAIPICEHGGHGPPHGVGPSGGFPGLGYV